MDEDAWLPDEEIDPEAVDAALRAFWAGSAGPLDRLFGGPDESGLRIGEMLLEVCDQLSRPRSRTVRAADDRLLARSAAKGAGK
jgi:hypothetical protein